MVCLEYTNKLVLFSSRLIVRQHLMKLKRSSGYVESIGNPIFSCCPDNCRWAKLSNVHNLSVVGTAAVLVVGGSWLLLIDTTPPHHQVIHQAEEGIQVAAGHRHLSCLAYAEKREESRIQILIHPGFQQVRTLPAIKGGTFKFLEFCEMENLVSLVHTIDGTDIIVWNWRTSEKIIWFKPLAHRPDYSIRVSPSAPLRIAEWNSEVITVWQVYKCYRKVYHANISSAWPSSVATPISCAWSSEGEIAALDAKGTLYSINLENGSIQKETDFPNPKILAEAEFRPCITWHSGGWVLHAEGQLAFVKLRADVWTVIWICPTSPINSLVSAINKNGKDLLFGWAQEGQLVQFKGDKTIELKVLHNFRGECTMACVIQPFGDRFVSFAKTSGQLSLWNLQSGLEVPHVNLGLAFGLLTMTPSPIKPFVVLGYIDGSVEVLDTTRMKRTKVYPTRHGINAVRFHQNGTTFCLYSRSAGLFSLIEDDGLSLKPAAFLQIDVPVTDFILLSERVSELYVLAAGGKEIFSFSLDREKSTFIPQKTILLQEVYLYIEFSTELQYFISVPSRLKDIHICDKNFGVVQKFPSEHKISQFTVKAIGGFIISYGVDGLINLYRYNQCPTGSVKFTSSLSFATHHRADDGVAFVDADISGSFLIAGGQDGCLIGYSTGVPRTPLDFNDENKCYTFELELTEFPQETWFEKWDRERQEKVQAEHMEARNTVLKNFIGIQEKLKCLLKENDESPEDERLPTSDFELDVKGREEAESREMQRRENANQAEKERIAKQDDFCAKIIHDTLAKIQVLSKELRPLCSSNEETTVQSYAVLYSTAVEQESLERIEERMRLVKEFHIVDFFQPWLPEEDSQIMTRVRESSHFLTRRTIFMSHLDAKPDVLLELPLPGPPTSTPLFIPSQQMPHSPQPISSQFQAEDIIAITEVTIRKLMNWFNEEFAKVAAEKERKLRGLAERRVRLRHVALELGELGVPCELQPEDMEDPTWALSEIPETLLTIKEAELKTAPSLTEDQLKEQCREVVVEETNKKTIFTDDFRKRVLHTMMDGVLEKKWEDEIKQDVSRPPFMDIKSPSEWTENETRRVRDYNELVEQLLIERDRYKKLLLKEFEDIKSEEQNSAASFDQELKQLYELKLRVESAKCQEEFKILRMRQRILRKLQLSRKEEKIRSAIAEEEKKMELLQDEAGKLQELLNEGRAAHETLVIRDKNVEKNFRKDFPECSLVVIEQLNKLTKKRPTFTTKSSNNASLLTELGHCVVKGNDPHPHLLLPHDCLEYLKAMNSLDATSNMPAVINESSWETLCRLRRIKIDSELKIRSLSIELAETEQTFAHWQKQLKICKDSILRRHSELEALQTEKRMDELNFSVQMVVPQGIVELPLTGSISDFCNAVLVSKAVVNEVNQDIQRVGQKKIRVMQKALEFRKEIVYKEWEHRKLRFKVEDLKAQLESLERIHVTKELQDILNSKKRGIYEERELAHLEREIAVVKERFAKSQAKLQQTIEEYNKKINALNRENAELDQRIVDLNKAFEEKVMMRDVNQEEREAKETNERMKKIRRRGRLLAKAQELEKEIISLESERDALCLKCYPSITQKGQS